MKMVSMQRIYENICSEFNADIDSIGRNLRYKFSFLMEHVMLRQKHLYQSKGNDVIPEGDAPIVQELLMKTVSCREEDEIFGKWLRGSLKKDDYVAVVELCDKIDVLFGRMCTDKSYYLNRKSKEYTNADENICAQWSSVIKSSLNYDIALWMLNLQKKLEELYKYLLPLKHTVQFGKVEQIVRRGLLNGDLKGFEDVKNKNISTLLKECYTQDSYINLIMLLLNEIEDSVKNTLAIDIVSFVNEKKQKGWKNISDSLKTEQETSENPIYELLKSDSENSNELGEKEDVSKTCIQYDLEGFQKMYENAKDNPEKLKKLESNMFTSKSIAQDDLRRFQSIYEFLRSEPENLKILEEKLGETDLLEYFCIENPNNKKKK